MSSVGIVFSANRALYSLRRITSDHGARHLLSAVRFLGRAMFILSGTGREHILGRVVHSSAKQSWSSQTSLPTRRAKKKRSTSGSAARGWRARRAMALSAAVPRKANPGAQVAAVEAEQGYAEDVPEVDDRWEDMFVLILILTFGLI